MTGAEGPIDRAAALLAGRDDPTSQAILALADAMREQTLAIHRLTERVEQGGGMRAAGADMPRRMVKPPPPPPPAKGGDMWSRLGLAEGERRRVTALFSDVSGFTAMSEKLDPEECNLIIKETMAELTAIIRRHDGYVEKFIGDAICAIFGAPVSHEDEPHRAARAAIEMHAALRARALRRPDLPELSMHIGINTGLVIAGTVGDGTQFGVMGDTVNTAARLMDKAVKYQTFVSAETARRIRRRFLLTDMGQYQMKGKELPVQAFLVERELSPAEELAALTLRAPLTGRDEELSALLAAADRVGNSQEGAVAVVVGEAGMGKTRVLDELANRIGDRMLVLSASGRPVGARPYGVVAEAFEPLINAMPEGDDREIAASVLTGGETADLHDLDAVLGRLLTQEAAQRPVAMFVDGFEHADRASIDIALLLMRRLTNTRVLAVLASRPGAPAIEAISLDGPSWITRLRLGPLSADRMSELLMALLPGALDPAAALRLGSRAEGNPAFAEEIALSLIDEGVVALADGAWVMVGDPDAVEIPGSIQEMIETRIDALPDASRIILEEAAVIGMEFSVELLRATATKPDSVAPSLSELVVGELLRAPDDGSTAYAFKSPVVREVAYQSILHRRRPVYHRRVGEALLAQTGPGAHEIADLLAHHFEAADDTERGVHYLGIAAERAMAAGAYGTAEQYLTRAVVLAGRNPGVVSDHVIGDLRQSRGLCRMVLDDHTGAVDDLTAASSAHEAAGRLADRAEIDERLAWFLVLSHRVDEGAATVERTLATTRQLGLEGLTVRGEALQLLVRALDGDLATVDEAAELIRRAEATGDPYALAKANIVAGGLRRWQGELGAALELLRNGKGQSEALQFPTIESLATRWLMLAEVEQGNWRAADGLARSVLSHGAETGDRHTVSTALQALGAITREAGDLEQSRSFLEDAITSAVYGHDRPAERVTAMLSLAATAALAGDTAAAADALARAEALRDEDDWLRWRLTALVELADGRRALASSDFAAALAAAEAATASLGGQEAQIERVRIALLIGEVEAAQGKPAAVEHLADALNRAQALGIPVLVVDAAVALAAAAPDRRADIAPVLAQALDAVRAALPDALQDRFDSSRRAVAAHALLTESSPAATS